ncbi:hypothetical protein QEN19_001194 [Hanseniaspora menglaensis]
MVVLENKDLNLSYQIGKKRQLNDTISFAMASLNSGGSEDLPIKANLLNDIDLKRHKNGIENKKEKEIDNESSVLFFTDELVRHIADHTSSVSSDNIRSLHSKGEWNDFYNSELNQEESSSYHPWNISFFDFDLQHENLLFLQTFAYTSTPKKRSPASITSECSDDQSSFGKLFGIQPRYNYELKNSASGNGYFHNNNVYLNEYRHLTPYTHDINMALHERIIPVSECQSGDNSSILSTTKINDK